MITNNYILIELIVNNCSVLMVSYIRTAIHQMVIYGGVGGRPDHFYIITQVFFLNVWKNNAIMPICCDYIGVFLISLVAFKYIIL